MHAHRTETRLTEDATLTLKDLPFHAGDVVEVIVMAKPFAVGERTRYPLRGTAYRYDNPTDPVAVEDWEVTQ